MKTCTKNINKIFELVALGISNLKDKTLIKNKWSELKEHAKTCDSCADIIKLIPANLKERISYSVRVVMILKKAINIIWVLTFFILTSIIFFKIFGIPRIIGYTENIVKYMPALISAFVIFVLGSIISKLIQRAMTKILQVSGFDKISEKIGLGNIIRKAEIRSKISEVIGIFIYWLSLFMVFITTLKALKITFITELLYKSMLYIPNVLAGIFILVLGMFTAKFLAATIRVLASDVIFGWGEITSQIVQILLTLFSVIVALEQLDIKLKFSPSAIYTFTGVIGAFLILVFYLTLKDFSNQFAISITGRKIKVRKRDK